MYQTNQVKINNIKTVVIVFVERIVCFIELKRLKDNIYIKTMLVFVLFFFK